jgi:hypothetical protein
LEEHITSIFRVKEKAKQEASSKLSLPIDSASFLIGLLFYPEGGLAQAFLFFF